MKNEFGFWMPDHEETLVEALAKRAAAGESPPRYQGDKYQEALRHVPRGRRGLALDVGAHIGLWTVQMLEDFDKVVCFEPDPQKHECWDMNVTTPRATLYAAGLSNRASNVRLVQKTGTSLKTHVARRSFGDIPMVRLDDRKLSSRIDFMKMDIEGYELFALRGAERTLRRDKPTIIIEQKPGVASKRYGLKDAEAVDLLGSWGWVVVAEMNGDYVMVPA